MEITYLQLKCLETIKEKYQTLVITILPLASSLVFMQEEQNKVNEQDLHYYIFPYSHKVNDKLQTTKNLVSIYWTWKVICYNENVKAFRNVKDILYWW